MSKKPTTLTPVEIAREAFQRLGARRISPTPDAYRIAYEEIQGGMPGVTAESVLSTFATKLSRQPGENGLLGTRLVRARENGDWTEFERQLIEFADANWQSRPIVPAKPAVPHGELVPIDLERQFIRDSIKEKMLREMLARILVFNLPSLLSTAPELANESRNSGQDLKMAFSEQAMNEIITRVKQLSFQIELKTDDMAQQQELLMRLFQLLLENINGLLEQGSWLSSQIETVQSLIAGPLSNTSLADATKNLKEVIYKQGLLKNTLSEEKVVVKNMMLTFVDRLSAMVSTTDNYQRTIRGFSQQISQAGNIADLNSVLSEIMTETQKAQEEATRSRDAMVDARQEVEKAEERIQALEQQLQQMGELVREDQLTGSLNRRGMDESLDREIANALRRETPLCVALLDLDDFKRINDTHGHATGDEVLVHLVQVIRETLRKLDVIARFGGEEFVILMPETSPQDAVQIITRVQRELTKRIFMHESQRLLITFSAGVSVYHPGESQAELLKRTDVALYKAKNAGKNRIVFADPPADAPSLPSPD
ncbi:MULTISPECIES: GGDEF domain-containing protein [Herbaspirillum]|uniref:diguanylate cyclase n=1 Tax=Herbaspirillum huttiense subsp. lycopersici TaxID=3074428 RepID=A0ABU2EGW2_9BURK|nr:MULTISPECIES: GGDEF domain-containing protein [Herbaspirillum]MAF03671.1 GGDEF domain-containing protein [Herbaspirillum sp.]MBN9355465.1 diguanylate cyclase [Herbaspirillum huttiense]MBO16873.1 GGDEF domain-containing protein [Herbaspirillum sp.]MBP1313879.1 diguanylate cyclase [Herbaspirillum sp. 1130]MCO4856104.1 diguanylate cyclase [Herbaspirillum sp. WGmk3]